MQKLLLVMLLVFVSLTVAHLVGFVAVPEWLFFALLVVLSLLAVSVKHYYFAAAYAVFAVLELVL